MKKQCDIVGCGRSHKAGGLCQKHHQRLLSGGDPYTPSRLELSIEARFEAKLGPPNTGTGCREWVGRRNEGGYGVIDKDGKSMLAHRLAYELKHGPVPAAMQVCHRCDNPPCCNDSHLFLGTQADNNADRANKGRSNRPKGASNGRAKLVEADVAAIRRRLASGEIYRTIADAFQITRTQVGHIKRGKAWAHLK